MHGEIFLFIITYRYNSVHLLSTFNINARDTTTDPLVSPSLFKRKTIVSPRIIHFWQVDSELRCRILCISPRGLLSIADKVVLCPCLNGFDHFIGFFIVIIVIVVIVLNNIYISLNVSETVIWYYATTSKHRK